MTDTFHQDQVKKATDFARKRYQVKDDHEYLDGNTFETVRDLIPVILTQYGQALRENRVKRRQRFFRRMLGKDSDPKESRADVEDDWKYLGIPPKETDATPECSDANCFDPGCTKPKETDA